MLRRNANRQIITPTPAILPSQPARDSVKNSGGKNARKRANAIEDSLKVLDNPPKFDRAEYIHQHIDSLYPNYGAVVDHIEYVINLVGEDYVGLGSDFCGISIPPIGLENVSKLPNITRELVQRGYNESTIQKILGGNFMRVFKEIYKK